MPGLKELDPSLWPGHSALLGIHTPQALLSAAQMNTVEFHTWNSTTRRINEPDRVVFVSALPKTRSAKIVRRAVRAKALGKDPGDLSSVENPEALEDIARAV